MFLLPTDKTRLVGFEALLAQAMLGAPAIPADALPKAFTALSMYSAPLFDETGDDDETSAIGEA